MLDQPILELLLRRAEYSECCSNLKANCSKTAVEDWTSKYKTSLKYVCCQLVGEGRRVCCEFNLLSQVIPETQVKFDAVLSCSLLSVQCSLDGMSLMHIH
jgi:hypothetical protein